MEPKKLRVLVVEDEGIIARDISNMLEQLDYEVSGEAGTGDEAIELASLVATDLVLMDIKLRGAADGIQTAAEIRKEFGIPVIFLTSHADSETLRRANQTQPFGYVVKPFNEADLKVAIEIGLNRHRLQQEAEEKQTWFDSALSSISDAVIATDTDGRIRHFNRAAEQLTGWRGCDALKRPFTDVIQARNDLGQRGGFDPDTVLCSHEPIPFASALITHRNGSERLIFGSVGPMRRPGSAVIHGVVAILRDLSDLAHTGRPLDGRDAFLRRSNEHLQELSYALSHELTEPVRNISCFAQLLERQDGSALDEVSREYLNFITESSKRIDAQFRALQEFHQAGSIAAAPGNSHAREICKEALSNLEGEAQVIVEDLPVVAISPSALRRIFNALLSNALRFRSEQPPCIRVSAVRAGDFWQFTVGDNGLGFGANEGERIFQLFTKAHEPKRCGTGVGLAICRRLVEGAGGRIWAESEPGLGSKFHFTLPAGQDQMQAA